MSLLSLSSELPFFSSQKKSPVFHSPQVKALLMQQAFVWFFWLLLSLQLSWASSFLSFSFLEVCSVALTSFVSHLGLKLPSHAQFHLKPIICVLGICAILKPTVDWEFCSEVGLRNHLVDLFLFSLAGAYVSFASSVCNCYVIAANGSFGHLWTPCRSVCTVYSSALWHVFFLMFVCVSCFLGQE